MDLIDNRLMPVLVAGYSILGFIGNCQRHSLNAQRTPSSLKTHLSQSHAPQQSSLVWAKSLGEGEKPILAEWSPCARRAQIPPLGKEHSVVLAHPMGTGRVLFKSCFPLSPRSAHRVGEKFPFPFPIPAREGKSPARRKPWRRFPTLEIMSHAAGNEASNMRTNSS